MNLENLEQYVNDNLKGLKVIILKKIDEFSVEKYENCHMSDEYSEITGCQIQESPNNKSIQINYTNSGENLCIDVKESDDIKFILE